MLPFAQWDTNWCKECMDHLVIKVTEHGGRATIGSKYVALWESARIWLLHCGVSLQMFGVPIDGPANVFCDNHGVVKNVNILELRLMKRHNAINYHLVWETFAAKIIWVAKEDGEMKNSANLFTKSLLAERQWKWCLNIMIWLNNWYRLEAYLIGWLLDDMIIALWYMLHMFGVPIDGPSNVFCDNHDAVKNMSILELTLMERHNAIN
jgi:hypothetical protein